MDAKVAMESGELAEFCCTPVAVMGFWPNAKRVACENSFSQFETSFENTNYKLI